MNARRILTATAAAVLAANLLCIGPATANPSDNANTFPHGSFDDDRFSELVIGAPDEDVNGLANAGAVHIIYGSETAGLTSSGSMLLTQAMIEPDPTLVTANVRFGASFAKGQFNDDYFWDLAVGAPGARNGAGVVYVIYGSDEGLDIAIVSRFSQDTPGVTSGSEAGDGFGMALSAGNFDNSGGMDLAIGVPNEDIDAHVDAGMVNLLFSTPSGLSGSAGPAIREVGQRFNDIGDAPESSDRFGASLAAGNFGDPISPGDDLAIGVPGENLATSNGSAIDSGLVHVLFGSSNGLDTTNNTDKTLTGDFFFANTVAALSVLDFGLALTAGRVRGNMVGDNFDDLVVGMPGYADNQGAVGVFFSDETNGFAPGDWTFFRATNTDGDDYVRYGSALAAWDFDSNGWDDIAIGAPYQDIDGKFESGAVYIKKGSFGGVGTDELDSGRRMTQGDGTVPGANEDNDMFGSSLAVGNFGGPFVHTRLQATADLAIGIPGERITVRQGAIPKSVLSGSVVTLYGIQNAATPFSTTNGQIWTQSSTGIADTAENGDSFGAAVQ